MLHNGFIAFLSTRHCIWRMPTLPLLHLVHPIFFESNLQWQNSNSRQIKYPFMLKLGGLKLKIPLKYQTDNLKIKLGFKSYLEPLLQRSTLLLSCSHHSTKFLMILNFIYARSRISLIAIGNLSNVLILAST